jgi:elongation factor P
MALLSYNEIRERKIILHEGEPCEVVESHVARTQQRKPQNQVKLKSLISGKTFAATFHVSDSAEEADISKRDVKYLYQNKGEYWFCDPSNPANRFKLEEKILGDAIKFFKDNMTATSLVWTNDDDEEIIIRVTPSVKMEFTVKEAPPSMKGNTASGGGKQVVLENGTVITTPMFIEAGEKVIVNTETGEYVERA